MKKYIISYEDQNGKLIQESVTTWTTRGSSIVLALKNFCIKNNVKLVRQTNFNQNWWEGTFPSGYVTTLYCDDAML